MRVFILTKDALFFLPGLRVEFIMIIARRKYGLCPWSLAVLPEIPKINSGNDAVNLRVSYVSKEFISILEIGNLLKEITASPVLSILDLINLYKTD